MLVYRVFAFDPAAKLGKPGHPSYLHKPQGQGRIDNPSSYDVWYLGFSPEAAIGEIFGGIPTWSDDMLRPNYMPSAHMALATFHLPDDSSLLDLDDARNLLDRGLRPTQIIIRNRAATQEWALNAFREQTDLGERKWVGVKWWSFYRPLWTVGGVWVATGDASPLELREVEPLTVDHLAIQEAARSLTRPFR